MGLEIITYGICTFYGKMIITLTFLFVGLFSASTAHALFSESCSFCVGDDSSIICERGNLNHRSSLKAKYAIIICNKKKFLTEVLNLPNVIEFRAINNTFFYVGDKTFSKMTKLEVVEVLGSKVKNISPGLFKNNPKITTVNLSDNLISDVSHNVFYNLRYLESVFLNKNKINKIKKGTFINNHMLKKIDLSKNYIDMLEAGSFNFPPARIPSGSAPTFLNISRNILRELPGSIFIQCNGLQILDLSYNRIETVHPKAFDGLSSLEELFLQGNNLQTVDGVCSGALSALRVLNLQMNPLSNCGCSDGAILRCKDLCEQVFLSPCDCLSTIPSRQVPFETALQKQSTIASETYVSSESSTVSHVTKDELPLTSLATDSLVSHASVVTVVDNNKLETLSEIYNFDKTTMNLHDRSISSSRTVQVTTSFTILDGDHGPGGGDSMVITIDASVPQTFKTSLPTNIVSVTKLPLVPEDEEMRETDRASLVDSWEFIVASWVVSIFVLCWCLGVMGVLIYKLFEQCWWRNHIYKEIFIHAELDPLLVVTSENIDD